MIEKPSERILKRRYRSKAAVLSITSMVDILTIMLIFLLKSFTTGEVMLTPMKDLELQNLLQRNKLKAIVK